MLHERSLKVLARFHAVLVATVRATVHAALVAALLAFVGGLLGLVLSMKMNMISLLLSLLIAPICVLLIWIILLIWGARDISLRTFPSELDHCSQELSRKLLTPLALSLGALILIWQLFSRSLDSGWLLGEEPLFGLAVGYFLAPILVRKEFLHRLMKGLESS